MWTPCDRLPILLDVCPACGGGIKPGLAFTWMSPKSLLEGDHMKEDHILYGADSDAMQVLKPCGEKDILCFNPPDRAGLMWVGTKFYSPSSFMKEAEEMGASKRIPAIPKGFVVGETWVILAHRQAARKEVDQHEFDAKGECKFCLATNNVAPILGSTKCNRKMPGIFSAFLPERIEKLVDDDTPQEEIEKLQKRGITVIKVPKGDKDHHGNVYADLEEQRLQDRPEEAPVA